MGALAALLLVGCSVEPSDEDVDWSTYADQFQEDVEAAIDSGDCQAMSDQWRRAESGSDAHRARYGDGNLELMQYISDWMDEHDCP